MKIKSKLHITMIVSILTVFLCLGIMADIFYRINLAGTLEKRADAIVKGTFELNMLTNDYLFRQSERAMQQWLIKHEQLNELMRHVEASEGKQAQFLETMLHDHETLKTLFLKLSTINEFPENIKEVIFMQLRDRMVGQITLTAQKVVTVAFQLISNARSELLSIQKKGGVIIMSLMTALTAIVIVNYFLLGRSIARPIINLQRSIEKIGHGYLNHRVPVTSEDEIGELGNAFNRMTSSLKKVTATRDILEEEIARREQVEEKLKNAREDLEERVLERTAELAETKQMLEKVTMGITDGIMLINTDYTILWANQYTPGFSKDKQSDVDRYCYEVIQNREEPCFHAGLTCPISEMIQTGQPKSTLVEYIDQDENQQFLDVIAYPVWDDNGEVDQFVHVSRNVSERIQLAEARKKSEERYRSLFNDALDLIHTVDGDGVIVDANPAEYRTLGYEKDEFIGKNQLDIFHPDEKEITLKAINGALEKGKEVKGLETAFITKTGKKIDVEVNAVPRKENGEVIGARAIIRNISDRKKLERQLLQAQKMESVGRLAGGVAHDFNNMLGVILGYSKMILEDIGPENPHATDLAEIEAAAKRSADLTRQLLAFARKQTIEPKVLDLNTTVEGMLKMLRRLIWEDIDLAWRPGSDIWQVELDPVQIDQILANLCVNARDAITGVGRVTIETKNITLDEAYCAEHLEFKPGRYVMLAVSDDGCGMDKETQDKIFEPFFTTKETGKGTGLGLSTVYGIVKQNGGFINVYSEPGHGTTIRIYILRHEGPGTEEPVAEMVEIPGGAGETILLVEDDPKVLTMTKIMLQRLGYKVLAVDDPHEALELFEKRHDEVRLLLTDVVMPQMSGEDLSKKISALKPGISVLFMSGYTTNKIIHQGKLDKGIHLVQKPFSSDILAGKVREVLTTKIEKAVIG